MDEFVDVFDNADQLERKVEQLSQAIGLTDPGEFGAKYIQHRIVNNGTLDYRVVPAGGKSHYAVIEEIDNNSAGVACGPVSRLRKNGFVVHDASVYTGDKDSYLLRDVKDKLPEEYLAVFVKYVGKEHPVIEYWDDEE